MLAGMEEYAMRPNIRSASGIVMMLAIIPIFAGLLACMPVPIGNPEKSRIDPQISGVWLITEDEDFEGMYLFQPYDKRTWLVVGISIEEGLNYAGEPIDIGTAEDAIKALEDHAVGNDGITASGAVLYKAWLTKLGGKVFMTWEPVGGMNSDGTHVTEFWFVWRVEKRNPDTLGFYMVNGDHEAFESALEATGEYLDELQPESEEEYRRAVDRMRPKWERALRKVAKNVDDEDLYGEPTTFSRLPEESLAAASRLYKQVLEFETN